ncbi:MAG: hypothetical protein F4X57_01485 [Chloroflexi bacterium]|nr:hypothetical protein [Chloroflexota bacterium]
MRLLTDTERTIAHRIGALPRHTLEKLAAQPIEVNLKTINFDHVPGCKDIAALWLEDETVYLDCRIPAKEVMGTLLHELAHSLAWREGYAGHCPEWLRICRQIGGNPGKIKLGKRRAMQDYLSVSLSIRHDGDDLLVTTTNHRLLIPAP